MNFKKEFLFKEGMDMVLLNFLKIVNTKTHV